ncbi:MAG: tetratricopeptide repeat protein [Vitreimonas sp.]
MPALNDLVALYNAGKLSDAVLLGDTLLQGGSDPFTVHTILGGAHFQLGQPAKAAEHYGLAAALRPQDADTHNNFGIALVSAGRSAEAIERFAHAAELNPAFAGAFNNLGFVLNSVGRCEEALGAFGKALQLDPNHADAYNNRGIALFELGRTSEAAADYRHALAINRNFAKAHNNLGNALARLGQLDAATEAFGHALTLNPSFAEAANNWGLALRNAGRSEDALALLEHAILLKPDFADAHGALGVALADLRRPAEAIAAFTRALDIDPNSDLIRAQRLHQQARICDWAAIAADAGRIPALGVSDQIVPPFAMLSLEDSPERHRLRAENFVREKFRIVASVAAPPPARPSRLRIGYFSADVHNHAVMYLIARVLELHDRGRFEIHVFSYGPASNDETRSRIRGAVEHFHEVSGLRDEEIAELSRVHNIDIAVDLNGYTQNGRLGIFAERAAPLQISYLGYPSTTGAPFMDYLISDAVLIPDGAAHHYSERVISLPHSYQANDNTQIIAERTPTRKQAGLPDEGFVFCCFNNSYKISAAEFDIWMRLLRQVEGSVLWLLKSGDAAEANLRKEAAARGVGGERLIFAKPLPLSDHLARHRLADLFLDTFNYNAHTTARDALWAGLPLVTKRGESFTARVAASLLTALELPELITNTPGEYAALALDLASNPARLLALRGKLAINRGTAPLFNSALTTTHLEAAYELVFERYLTGAQPAALAVPALTSPC